MRTLRSTTPPPPTRSPKTSTGLLSVPSMLRSLLLIVLFLASTSALKAQFDSGAVLGTIKDPSGAGVSNASVELLSVSKGTTSDRRTSTSGDYEFDNVQPGDYVLTVTAPGFEKSRTDPFTVLVGSRQRVSLALKIGADTQSVTVSGAASVLETDTSDRGTTVETVEAVTLPLNGRNYADLSLLVPGVKKSNIAPGIAIPQREGSFNVNGLTSMDNNFTLDGIDNNAYQEANQGYANEAMIPSPDAVQEFKVQTDNFSAEYGRAGGAVVNVNTRSGTNSIHGGLYEYLRNTVLNAFGPFYGTGVKPTLVQNQFGATLGGPILKDRLFLFMDYEGLRIVQRQLTTATLPTPAMLSGLFTYDGTSNTTYTDSSGTIHQNYVPVRDPYTSQVFVGQVPLTESNIDPVALLTFQNLPTPNIAGANASGVAFGAANYQSLPASTVVDNKGDARVDYTLNSKQNGFFRYSQRGALFYAPAPFPGSAGGNNNGSLYAQTRQIVAGWNWTVTANSILDFRFGETWTKSGKSPIFLGAPNYYTLAGITNANIPTDPSYTGGLNAQAVGGGFSAFGEQTTNPQFTNPTQANPRVNYTWVKGHHSLKVGYEFGWLSQAISDFHPKFGSDTYSGTFSSVPSGSIPAGYAATTTPSSDLADFLFGARNTYSLNAYQEVNYLRYWHMGYVQDDWKALPNLTVNVGLRYEFVTPNYEQDNKIYNYDPTNQRLVTPGNGTDVNSTTAGHVYNLHYNGGNSLSARALVNPDYKDLGPRIGFAYQVLPKTVIRGGYALSYAHLFRFGGEGLIAYNGPNNYDATITQATSQGLCVTAAGSLAASLNSDPSTCFRRTQDGYETNFAGPTNFSTLKSQTRYQLVNFKTPYVQAYHLSVQQELPQKITLEVAYVGNHAVHVAALEDTNQARLCTATEISSGACVTTGTASLQNRRPISTFTDILTETNAGFLLFNSLQTKVERRFNNGIYLINSLTWSRGINNSSADLETQNGDIGVVNIANPRGDIGPSGYNQPYNDTTSAIIDLPFGRGKQFANKIPLWEEEIIGGWQLTGINTATAGVPLNLSYTPASTQVVTTNSSSAAVRPNIVSTNSAVYGSTLIKGATSLSGFFNPAGVSAPSGSVLFGNAGRNNLRGPGYESLDLSAHKKFVLPQDRYNLEFRIEAFNVFNFTNYISPSLNIGSESASGAFTPASSFGTFSGASSVYPSRQVQVALRLGF